MASRTAEEPRRQDGDHIACTINGNHLTILESGPTLRETLIALIDGAEHSLKICYYIFDSDASGRLVLARLIRAVRRGVQVSLMVDAFGGSGAKGGFFDSFVEAGGRFAWFGARRSTRYLIRNHQKLVIADDARLLMGGFNVADSYFGIPPDDCWHDLGLWLEGPEVEAMVRWYGQLWRWVAGRKQKFGTLRAMVRRWHPVTDHDPANPFRWLIGGPTQRLSPWAKVVKHDLEHGRRLDMIEAYFSPGQGMLRRLWRLAKRGDARLVMAAKSDNGATVAAARLLYGPLLKRGAQIYEYQPCKLHMKLIVIDDALFIGSANFDMRSLFVNLELMLRIEDAALAERMRGFVGRQIADSRHITPEVQAARSGFLTLAKGWISYFLVGFLDYTVTRRLNFRRRPDD
ncbi:phosphatidylserine/phosphatidylglycerophosphate/cardiolipin synthase family protein [Sphingobium phenoxybenzoativorans]|uniref:Phospholipase D n=1 Tax=Sphingobium phenoxybenzoativorans TaxID=1592790 RepID=A0A975K7P0_9SPHN|nr:phosphatidylserine/phosphatidylglycerophosphate/cardiolipin synthase family protein [Sphingobium phenoxybenzoativorans]QUT05598.1 phosphatidylserine/phosphatidylglycerophosphate/cardiolipin synthase family protein [Sphingobium phenoxybenzoativorans]